MLVKIQTLVSYLGGWEMVENPDFGSWKRTKHSLKTLLISFYATVSSDIFFMRTESCSTSSPQTKRESKKRAWRFKSVIVYSFGF